MMHPKSYYSTYLANDNIYEIDRLLVNEVLKLEPLEVFDFGTGTGKNLKLVRELSKYPINLCGLDVSMLNIIHAKARNEVPFLIVGDEYFLCRLTAFDVAMTCSVLCHIKNIDSIVKDLKNLTNKGIVIAETIDIVGDYYYAHDYESFGFINLGIEWYSEINKATYKLYRYLK